jgi:hypothetical protein
MRKRHQAQLAIIQAQYQSLQAQSQVFRFRFGGQPPGTAVGRTASAAAYAALASQLRARPPQISERARGLAGQVNPGPSWTPGQSVAGDPLAQLRADHQTEERQALLRLLPAELREPLALAVLEGAERRRVDTAFWEQHGEYLQIMLGQRVAPAIEESMRAWRRHFAPQARFTIEVWVALPGEAPSIVGLVDDGGGWAAACLPLAWVRNVWAKGIAVVDGCFVVAAGRAARDGIRKALALRWERNHDVGSVPVLETAVIRMSPTGPVLHLLPN